MSLYPRKSVISLPKLFTRQIVWMTRSVLVGSVHLIRFRGTSGCAG